jgi:predicted restriction endonuclease
MFCRYFSSLRPEYAKFRKYLVKKYIHEYGGCHCSMCLNRLPLELLDMAHLKPRYILNLDEIKNIENVQFLCKMCHSIYDRGYVSVNNVGIIESNNSIKNYTLPILNQVGKIYSKYSNYNSQFLEWHYMNIFKKK